MFRETVLRCGFTFACLLTLGLAQSVAAPINSFNIGGSTTPQSGHNFTLSTGNISGTVGAPPNLDGGTSTALPFNITSVTSGIPGSNDGTFSVGTGGTTTMTITAAGGTATFQFINTTGNFDLGAKSISNDTQLFAFLTGVTGALNLADFGGQNAIFAVSIAITDSISVTATIGTPGNVAFGTLSPGDALNFSRTGGFFNPNGPSVPEPATLATFGLMGLFGAYAARRKLKAQAQSATPV